jgi:hypothetical protein
VINVQYLEEYIKKTGVKIAKIIINVNHRHGELKLLSIVYISLNLLENNGKKHLVNHVIYNL